MLTGTTSTYITTIRPTTSIAAKATTGSTTRNTAEMLRMAIGTRPIDSVAVDLAGSAVRVGLANTAALAESEALVVSANRAGRAVRVVLENQEEQAVWENRVVSVNPVALVVVAVHQVPSPPVVRAAAERIVLVVTVHPAEEVTARSGAEAPTSLARVAAEGVIVW